MLFLANYQAAGGTAVASASSRSAARAMAARPALLQKWLNPLKGPHLEKALGGFILNQNPITAPTSIVWPALINRACSIAVSRSASAAPLQWSSAILTIFRLAPELGGDKGFHFVWAWGLRWILRWIPRWIPVEPQNPADFRARLEPEGPRPP